MDYKQKYEEDNMITEDYCSQDVVQLLREKGFPVGVGSWSRGFVWDGEGYLPGLVKHENSITHQMAMKWLREEHGFHISVAPYLNNEGEVTWVWEIINIETATVIADSLDGDDFNSCEPAVEAALKHCLTELI